MTSKIMYHVASHTGRKENSTKKSTTDHDEKKSSTPHTPKEEKDEETSPKTDETWLKICLKITHTFAFGESTGGSQDKQ